MSYFELDAKSYDKVINAVSKFANGREAETIINEYLWGEGSDLIKQGIQALLPSSGRRWKGKRTAASATDPFIKTQGNLSVKVHTKNGYHYLYFPDDGSNTVKHMGNQQFMFDGTSNKAEEIANETIDRLIKRLEES